MIVVDCEMTGLDPYKHSIISIGAIDFDNPEREFYVECQPWDGAELVEESMAIHGITDVNNPDKPTLKEALQQFVDWSKKIKDKTLCGQNVQFDFWFLKLGFEKSNLTMPYGYRTVDIHAIYYAKKLQEGKVALANNVSALSITNMYLELGLMQEPDPHNALTGAKMEAEGMSRMLFKKKLLKEFDEYPLQ